MRPVVFVLYKTRPLYLLSNVGSLVLIKLQKNTPVRLYVCVHAFMCTLFRIVFSVTYFGCN
jgi:hypothetical protein